MNAGHAEPAVPPAPGCVTGDDEAALQIRAVDTELTIAGYACSEVSRYTSFSQAELVSLNWADQQLDRFFNARGGAAQQRNAFMQRLSSAASVRYVDDPKAFCEQSGYLFDALAQPGRKPLRDFVASLLVASRHGFASCQPPAILIAFSAGGPIEVAADTSPVAATPASQPEGAPKAPPVTAKPIVGKVPVPKPKPPSLKAR